MHQNSCHWWPEVMPSVIHRLLSIRVHLDPALDPPTPFWSVLSQSPIWSSPLNLAKTEGGAELYCSITALCRTLGISTGLCSIFITKLKTLMKTPMNIFSCVWKEQRPSEQTHGPCDHLTCDLPFPWCKCEAGGDSEVLTKFCFQSRVCLSDSKGCRAAWIEAKGNVDANPAKQASPLLHSRAFALFSTLLHAMSLIWSMWHMEAFLTLSARLEKSTIFWLCPAKCLMFLRSFMTKFRNWISFETRCPQIPVQFMFTTPYMTPELVPEVWLGRPLSFPSLRPRQL